MGIKDALTSLSRTKSSIKAQQIQVENRLDKLFNDIIGLEFTAANFVVDAMDKEFYFEVTVVPRPNNEIDPPDKVSDSFAYGNTTAMYMEKHLDKIPQTLRVALRIRIDFPDLQLRNSLVVNVFRRAEFVKVGFLSKRLEDVGSKILYYYIPPHENYDHWTTKVFDGPLFFEGLSGGFSTSADHAEKFGLILLFLKNLERYLTIHISNTNKIVKGSAANGDVRMSKVPLLMTSCKNCGAPNPDNDTNCAYCNSPLVPG